MHSRGGTVARSLFLFIAASLVVATACAPAPPGVPTPGPDHPATDLDRSSQGCPVGVHHDLCARSVVFARSNTAARAIKFAFAQVGVPYDSVHRFGPSGYDCSGLVWRSYIAAGVDIGANLSSTIVGSGGPRTEIPISEVRPGDAIWYPGHIAIELADGYMIEAAKPGTNVRVVRTAGRGFSRAVAIAGY
ncbi:MAG: C40 family peptidase [Microthrixaceae bacterium]